MEQGSSTQNVGASAMGDAGRVLEQLLDLARERFGFTRDAIKPQTSFVELGADSLSLLQLSTVLRKKFGVRVPFRLFFDKLSSVEASARFVNRATYCCLSSSLRSSTCGALIMSRAALRKPSATCGGSFFEADSS